MLFARVERKITDCRHVPVQHIFADTIPHGCLRTHCHTEHHSAHRLAYHWHVRCAHVCHVVSDIGRLVPHKIIKVTDSVKSTLRIVRNTYLTYAVRKDPHALVSGDLVRVYCLFLTLHKRVCLQQLSREVCVTTIEITKVGTPKRYQSLP